MMRTFLAAAVVLLAGCSGDSTGPTHASVNGTWRFTFSNMTGVLQGVAVSCNGGSLDFTITQSNRTFSGVQVGTGRITCFAELVEDLLDVARTGHIVETRTDVYGTRYVVDGLLPARTRTPVLLRTVWMVDHGLTIPRLITASPA